MPDLYAHLGIDKSADKASIRRAYRRRASKDHPDMPTGSKKSFALTKLAHDILTDSTRRARYDSTGDTSESSPDNARAQILEVIAALIGQTLQNCAQHNVSPTALALNKELISLANNSIAQFRKDRAQIDSARPKFEKLLGRFTKRRKKPTDSIEPNVIEAVIQGQLAGIAQALTQIDAKISRFEEAAKLLAEYDFRADAPNYTQRSGTSASSGPDLHAAFFRIV